jgi:UDP-N-acetylglucosamine transferase subunit ALG13
MIFVTVGTQLPFERLIDAVDAFAASHPDEEIVAQTGEDAGPQKWSNLTLVQRLTPEDFAVRVRAARLIVAHAGIGTILSAKQYGRPLILVPRRHDLGEHRNHHQMATARQMENRSGLYVCWDIDRLGDFMSMTGLVGPDDEATHQKSDLIKALRRLLQEP